MTEQEQQQTDHDKLTKIFTVLIGMNGTPGFFKKFDDFMDDWVVWQTKGRFENCPYLNAKNGKRWAIGLAFGIGIPLLTLGCNVAWKVLGI
jgi:hypothetical protein